MLAQRLCDLKQGYTQYGGKSSASFCVPLCPADGSSRPSSVRCLAALRRLRSALQLPAVPLGPIGKLLWLEGYQHRREQRHGAEPTQARVQGRDHDRGRHLSRSAGDEQDHGQHDARQRETYVTALHHAEHAEC